MTPHSYSLGAQAEDTIDDLARLSPNNFAGDSVDLYVNSTCNLKCKTCFLGDDYFQITHNMSIGNATGILQWAHAAGVNDIAFLGGEPSLHPRIKELLQIARDTGIPTNRFVTNGTKPFQRLLSSEACRYMDVVYVSLDGPSAESNDQVRGKGVFKQATQTMAMLRHSKIPFIITASITPQSCSELPLLFRLAEDSGCRTLNIHWVSPTGRARNGSSSVSPETWIELCRTALDYQSQRSDFSIHCQPAYWWPALGDQEPPLRRDACSVRELTNLQFMPDGSVYACGLMADQPGLNGYEWDGESLTVRKGTTELTICQTSPSAGCPVRHSVVGAPLAESTGYVPLCIYQRLHNAHD